MSKYKHKTKSTKQKNTYEIKQIGEEKNFLNTDPIITKKNKIKKK